MKLLSIIVPTYNVRLYVGECVQSLLHQDYKNFEIIIVDDGSNDGSSEICDSLQRLDSRVKVIHQKNAGLSSARNSGLKVATGDYISFIDSDDLVSPTMFTELIDSLEKNNADVAICNFEVFNRENRYKGTRYIDEVIDYSKDNQVKFFGAALDSSCNRVYRSEPIKKNGIYFEHKNVVAQEDFWFLVRLFCHISRIVTVSSGNYLYRERGSSISKSHTDGDITRRCLDFVRLSKNYISRNTDREFYTFMYFQYVSLFMASVNNASDTSISTIYTITNSYFKEKLFREAISKENLYSVLQGVGFKHEYDKLCFFLLRNNCLKLFSFLESLRLKKLRSNTRRDLYFE